MPRMGEVAKKAAVSVGSRKKRRRSGRGNHRPPPGWKALTCATTPEGKSTAGQSEQGAVEEMR
eukprot:scaffold16872_cov121-Isochrysis_galbana.AAC.3